jgi:hypothetical protein
MKARKPWLASVSAWLERRRRRRRRRHLRVVGGGLQRMPRSARLREPDAPRVLHTVGQRRVKAS